MKLESGQMLSTILELTNVVATYQKSEKEMLNTQNPREGLSTKEAKTHKIKLEGYNIKVPNAMVEEILRRGIRDEWEMEDFEEELRDTSLCLSQAYGICVEDKCTQDHPSGTRAILRKVRKGMEYKYNRCLKKTLTEKAWTLSSRFGRRLKQALQKEF